MKTISYQSAQWTPTARASLLGAKPSFKATKNDPVTPSDFAHCVRAFSHNVARKTIQRARHDCEHLRAEFEEVATSALGLWIARRNRLGFDSFAYLRARIVYSIQTHKPRPVWPLSLWRAALKDCEAMQRKTAREVSFDDVGRFYDATYDADFAESDGVSEGISSLVIRKKADAFRNRTRERAKENGNAARAGRQWLAFIDQKEANALALIRGEALPYEPASPDVRFVTASHERGTESLFLYENQNGALGRPAMHDGKGGAAGVRTVKRADGWALHNAGLAKLRRFQAFLGVSSLAA